MIETKIKISSWATYYLPSRRHHHLYTKIPLGCFYAGDGSRVQNQTHVIAMHTKANILRACNHVDDGDDHDEDSDDIDDCDGGSDDDCDDDGDGYLDKCNYNA